MVLQASEKLTCNVALRRVFGISNTLAGFKLLTVGAIGGNIGVILGLYWGYIEPIGGNIGV